MPMKVLNHVEEQVDDIDNAADTNPLTPLVLGRATASIGSPAAGTGIVVGQLIGMCDNGHIPLVTYPGQSGSAGIAARAILDLHGAHIGKQVVLAFDGSDPAKPIVMGVLRDTQPSVLGDRPGTIDVDVDGE